MSVVSIRELNANVSRVLSRIRAGETIDVSSNGEVFAEIRPKRVDRLADPEFRAAYERLLAALDEGVPGLSGPVSYEDRTGR